jgi:hypothetical protein
MGLASFQAERIISQLPRDVISTAYEIKMRKVQLEQLTAAAAGI